MGLYLQESVNANFSEFHRHLLALKPTIRFNGPYHAMYLLDSTLFHNPV
jgi:hypothetical protein